jgi:hypothetical protein
MLEVNHAGIARTEVDRFMQSTKKDGGMNMKLYGDVLASADAAKTAIRVLKTELADTDVGADRALQNLSDTVASLDAETHPLTQPEVFLFGDFRWAHRNHWDQWAWSMERIAEACDAKLDFTEKYDYLRVDVVEKPQSKLQNRALHDLANYVELISDYEILAES